MTVGSPQSTLCGLPKSGQESPNGGASKGTSPPSSPLEQKPADPWELLYEAAGQVARMQAASSMPVQANNAYGFNAQSGFAPPARTTTRSRTWSRSARCRLLRCVSSRQDSSVVSFRFVLFLLLT